MNSTTHDLIVESKSALDDLERRGTKDVSIGQVRALMELLDSALQADTGGNSAAEMELYKARLHAWVLEPGRSDAFALEESRQVSALGHSALNSALLVNGGASVALLTFLGHLSTFEALRPYLGPFATSLVWFSAGVVMSAVASGAAFLTGRFAQAKLSAWRTSFDGASIFLVICAYVAFIVGCERAYCGFTSLHNTLP